MKEEKQQSGEKIGEYIKNAMRELFYQDMLPAEVVKQLESKDFCRETFGIGSPVLVDKKALSAEKGGNSHYYKEPLFDNFFIYNEWSETARALFDSWLDSVILKNKFPKQEIKVFVGYSWYKGAPVSKDIFWSSMQKMLSQIRESIQDRYSRYNIRIGIYRLRASHGEFVFDGVLNRIKEADFLIFDVADVSSLFAEKKDGFKFVGKFTSHNSLIYDGFNANVLFELGMAFALRKKIFVFCPKCLSGKLPSDLNNFMWSFYNTKREELSSAKNGSKKYTYTRELLDNIGFVNKFRGVLLLRANELLENLKK